jgi:DNA repair protein RadC
MPKKPSSFDGESYRGYRVSLKLVRENLEAYEPVRVNNTVDIYRFMADLKHFDRERFYSLLLDTKNTAINCEEISSGTLSSSLVHPREVFKSALLCSCNSIILVHNLPAASPSHRRKTRR